MQNEQDHLDDDSSDEEYIPEGAVDSDYSGSNSDSGCEDTDHNASQRKRKKRRKNQSDEDGSQLEVPVVNEEVEKAKSDRLWEEFLNDQTTTPETTKTGPSLPSLKGGVSSKSNSAPPQKVTLTTTYDFAGEVVSVSKEVAADSKEAKAAVKASEPETKKPAPAAALLAKRPPSLSGLLGSIGKKPKMSTLEKSKLDWDSFKQKEGIADDLQVFSKGKSSYVERQAFLQRTDVRQFEVERDLRLSRRSK